MTKFGQTALIRLVLVLLTWPAVGVVADWPTLHGNPQHTGFLEAELKPPFRLAWARHFPDERLGTAMEPIVAAGEVFVATHSGSLYCLEAREGAPRWRFRAQDAFLQSPVFAEGLVVAASVDGRLYALDAGDGHLRWSFLGGTGGFSAAPVTSAGRIFVGTRAGEFLAVALQTGKLLWRQPLAAPIRQTAAVADARVFVTSEDLRTHCFEVSTGTELWTSDALPGQTARDYYPVVVGSGARSRVIVRTNPIQNMGQRIARDRHFLCQQAGVDDRDWRQIEAWTKSEKAHGNASLWQSEQQAVGEYLQQNREAGSFFILDAATGKATQTAPVLWIAGCQGVGVQPALTRDGRLLVFYRSAYGNWNHGVAPLVALGLLDLEANRIAPLFHQFGRQPAWNTFWGTADESQNFTVAGNTVLIVHQGTLSGFDLRTSQLFPIWGNRDTYGGFSIPAWARNEWHGPGRGSVAVADERIYWITGSRVLCLVSGTAGKPAADSGETPAPIPTQTASIRARLSRQALTAKLATGMTEFLSRRWAPLFVEPGLAGADFSFDHSGAVFEALAWCYPHLSSTQQVQLKAFLAQEWLEHPPYTPAAWYSLQEGARREFCAVPTQVQVRAGQDKPSHPFGNIYGIWLYAERCGEWRRVLDAWPRIRETYRAFSKSGWKLDEAKGDLYANRYLASLIALKKIAAKAGDGTVADEASQAATAASQALVAWWKSAASHGTLTTFKGASELDPFINAGDRLSLRVAPHRHKLALFQDLEPEIAARITATAPEEFRAVWRTFNLLYATWPRIGEERQVHSGENFVDPPDLAAGAFRALKWLQGASSDDLARCVDLPYGQADLYYLTKLALVLE